MDRLTELEMNSIGFAILCNFPRFCGEGRAKEASEMFRSMKEEIMAYRAHSTIEELSALVKARDEGRVVVLPEDGMLYHFEEIPETGERWVGNKPIQKITFTCGFGLVGIPFDFSQLGKTFFLTRAEAEVAIQKGGLHETDPV